MFVDAGEVEVVGVLFGQFLGLEGRDDAVGVVGVVELDFGLNKRLRRRLWNRRSRR